MTEFEVTQAEGAAQVQAAPESEFGQFVGMSLHELNLHWPGGSARDAPPELQRKIGAIKKQWHTQPPLGGPADPPTEDHRAFGGGLPDPVPFGSDPETGESLLAYPALVARFEAGGGRENPAHIEWQYVYHPFKSLADQLHQHTVSNADIVNLSLSYYVTVRDRLRDIKIPHGQGSEEAHRDKQALQKRLETSAARITVAPQEAHNEVDAVFHDIMNRDLP